jgi:quercetin dioxygenase-like cupin family protein
LRRTIARQLANERSNKMRSNLVPGFALLAGLGAGLGYPAVAQQHGAAAPDIAKPNLVLQQIVEELPQDDKQTVRVMTATFKPGDKTVYHTHRFPVTVYVLEGAFTLELDGRPPLTVKAGEALVEPPKVPMTGYNRSTTETTRVVIFYVSANDTPFLDMMSH